MGGTKAGGLKVYQANIAKDPDYYKKLGKIGGTISRGGGFTGNPERARKAGAKGGAIGGLASTKRKGFGSMSPERVAEVQQKGRDTRQKRSEERRKSVTVRGGKRFTIRQLWRKV